MLEIEEIRLSPRMLQGVDTGDGMWVLTFRDHEGRLTQRYYGQRYCSDELAVMKRFLWEQSDDYPYRHYRAQAEAGQD